MLKEQLKERAQSLVQIPDHFQPVLEEYFEGENGEGEAMFTWTDDQHDEGISLTLDLDGNLTRLSIEMKKENAYSASLDETELRQRAEQFLLDHYPHALQHLTLYQTKKLTKTYRFYYEQLVMNLPLDDAGCFVDVDARGEIVEFKYNGLQPEPEVPKKLIAKEKLSEHVKNRLDFQLIITRLDSVIHNVTEDGLRLVYKIEPFFMKYKAGVLVPTLTIIHEEDEKEKEEFVTLPPLPETIVQNDLSSEEIIGISEEMEVIREVDWGEETGIVWRDQGWTLDEDVKDLSMDRLFKKHNEDTVKAFISKKTGKITRFMWIKDRTGDLSLSQKECYQIAIAFLQMIIPDYYQYLQLIVHDNGDEQNDTRIAFNFHVHNGHGIPIFSEIVVVSVNRQTGQIDYYSGPSSDLEQLQHIPSEAAISKKEAYDIFSKHLDFKLIWDKNYEENNNILAYQACDRHTGKSFRYIDAITGEIITEKD
nr:YcdB/YcdC domain-containing protein [Calidifontibacillus oryziterrae]